MDPIKGEGNFFLDSQRNVIFLRGVNISEKGLFLSSPIDSTTNHTKDIYFEGKAFKALEFDEYFYRLKKLGFNLVKIPITWESLEATTPNQYNEGFIEYLIHLIKYANKKGFYVILSPYQKNWSRFCGGFGAPEWTLALAGIDIYRLLQSQSDSYSISTMFTLFFAGRLFAPYLSIDGTNIQDYLQKRYIAAFSFLAEKIASLKNVIGICGMDYANSGYIGIEDLRQSIELGLGIKPSPTPLEDMYSSEGNSPRVNRQFLLGDKFIKLGKVRINKERVSIWKEKKFCVWRMHGVWNYDPNGAPMILRPDYFYSVKGKRVDFHEDCIQPFLKSFQISLSQLKSKFLIFQNNSPSMPDNQSSKNPILSTKKWSYKGNTFIPILKSKLGFHLEERKVIVGTQKNNDFLFKKIQSALSVEDSSFPLLVDEISFGTFLKGKLAWSENRTLVGKMIDWIYSTIEKNLSNVILQNYGDNQSLEFQNKNGFCIYAEGFEESAIAKNFSHPYPISTQGIPISIQFDVDTRIFKYSFKRGPWETGDCTIYIPPSHYKNGIKVLLNAGSYSYSQEENLLYFKGQMGVDIYGISIRPA